LRPYFRKYFSLYEHINSYRRATTITALINRSYSAKWRYLVWLIIAVRLLIPFSPSIAGEAPVTIPSVSQNVQIPIPLPANTNLSEQTNIIPTQPTPVVTPNSSAVRTITLADLLPVIWLIGAILFMTYYFAGYIVFRKSANIQKRVLCRCSPKEICREREE